MSSAGMLIGSRSRWKEVEKGAGGKRWRKLQNEMCTNGLSESEKWVAVLEMGNILQQTSFI